MPLRHASPVTGWRLLLIALPAIVYVALSTRTTSVAAQSTGGVSRSWSCWSLSIADQSIFHQVAPDAVCESAPRPSSLRLGPRRAFAPLAVPAAPTSLAASVSGPTVVLTWTAPAAGDPPTSYVLEVGSTSGQSDLVNSDTGSSSSTLIATSVPPGTYYARVRARNAGGTSAASNEVAVVVTGTCNSAPFAPTDLRAFNPGGSPSDITLTWNAPGTGCPPTSYRIEAGSAPGGSDLVSFSTGNGETSFTALGVPSGFYYVRVRAVNGAGASGFSNELLLHFGGCANPPAAPTSLTGQIGGSSVLLSWTAASGSPSSYVLEAGSSSGSSNIAVSDTGSLSTSLTASAAPGTYYVRVRAKNACGTSAASNEVIVVVPSSTGCVTISPTSQTVGDSAVIGSVTVTGTCTWTAVSSASFVTITSGTSGTGSGTVSYSVAANTTGAPRSATLTIGGQTFTLTQQSCSYAASTPALFPDAGGTAAVAITTSSACSWAASSDASFATIASASSGTGSGSITVNVAANSGIVRGATLTIGRGTVTTTTKVVQSGPGGSSSCVTSILACHSIGCDSATFTASGGTGELILSAPTTCAWITAPSVPWLAAYAAPTAANTAYGIGNGHFGFSVAANPATTRSGSLVAGGLTFAITQTACTYTVSPTAITVLASGGTGVIGVTSTCEAAWTAVSNASFITVTAGSSGTGNGSVTVSIAANSGSSRTGTLTIGGQTVVVNQSAP